jgi:putative tryptophan/tyrosine transport system substrate-binding protein
MRRREFIRFAGSVAATWPFAARAQQMAVPAVGFLSSGVSAEPVVADRLRAFRQVLSEAGYVEGRNVAIEYRWAEGQYDRLPALAAELASQHLAVIVAIGVAALAAKNATATIPIVFLVSEDPVRLGLVASLGRPGGNATGVNFFVGELGAKQLGLLHELIPSATRIGLLVNPNSLEQTERIRKDVTTAASDIGLKIEVVQASNSREIEAAFETLARNGVDALLVGADAFFVSRRVELAIQAVRHRIPALYNVREYAEAGGLMSYGTDVREAYRQMGIYTGKILKGAKPVDLPVIQSTKFELVINLITARALSIEVSPTLLARADEVIE